MNVSHDAAAEVESALSVRLLSKRFAGQLALDSVDLQLAPGKVTALVGHNGSGKSTLIKILSGYHAPEPGAGAEVFGKHLPLGSSSAAHAAGLRFIHQDLGLIDDLDAVENIALGRGYERRLRIDWKVERRRTEEVLERLGVLDLDVRAPVGGLSAPHRSMVSIARAIGDKLDSERVVLILDEPTVSLSPDGVEALFRSIRKVTAEGGAVLYVSHNLEELLRLADDLIILRNGKRVGGGPAGEFDQRKLINAMLGAAERDLPVAHPGPTGGEIFVASGLAGGRLKELTFGLRAGEILGVSGLDGSGREDLPRLLAGAWRPTAGEMALEGEPLRLRTPRDAVDAGIVLLPGDRTREGGIGRMTLRENLNLLRIASHRGGVRDSQAERRETEHWLRTCEVRPMQPEGAFESFSGGNQQKVLLARCLRLEPRILILDEPTKGVDVAAKFVIYGRLAQLAKRGMAILVCALHPEDLIDLCDRALVLREGRKVAELEKSQLTVHELIRRAT